jgi:hypothetical protein
MRRYKLFPLGVKRTKNCAGVDGSMCWHALELRAMRGLSCLPDIIVFHQDLGVRRCIISMAEVQLL